MIRADEVTVTSIIGCGLARGCDELQLEIMVVEFPSESTAW